MISVPTSSLGLGCVTFGREIDQQASFIMMDHAWNNGITYLDTAAAYGGGASEQIVGEWARSRGYAVRVATKLLPPFDGSSILQAAQASLRRLGMEQVDTLYLHRWDASLENSASLKALQHLLDTGKVVKIAASNFNAAQLNSVIALQRELGITRFSEVQNNHNYAVSDLTPGFLEICANNKLRIVTYSPLAAGFLTGKHLQGVDPGSRFQLMPAHQDIYFNEPAQKKLEHLLAISAQTGYQPAQLALAWALRQQADVVLVGGRTKSHLDQAIDAQKFADPEVLGLLDS